MSKTERYEIILSLLAKQKYMSVEELSRQVFVSPSTLRRDLAQMSRCGYLIRSHGGAMALTPGEAEDNIVHHQTGVPLNPQYSAIVQAAAELIQDGDTVFLGASSLVLGLAPLLKAKRRVTLVTNSLQLPLALPEGRHRLFCLGGSLSSRSMSLVGNRTVTSASRFNYRIAFFGCSGISGDYVTCHNSSLSALMMTVLDHTDEGVLLCPKDRISRVAAINAVPLTRFRRIITDSKDDFESLSLPHTVILRTKSAG